MYNKLAGSRFKSDLKVYKNNPKVLEKLDNIISMICSKKKLPNSCREHSLKGEFFGIKECHIFPDVILIYEVDDRNKCVRFIRIGSHSNLFK